MKRKKIGRQNWIFGLLCGILLGGGAILPGISGSVLCVIFGLYQPLMQILSHPKRNFPKYWTLFAPVAVGWPVGFFVLAKLLTLLFGASEAVSSWLLIGLVLGTFPSLYREAGKEGRGKSARVSLAACFLAMTGLLYLSHVTRLQVTPGWGWYVFSGALFGASLVIPGLTASPILMALNLYQPLLASTASFDASVLLGVLPGMTVTAALLARLMSYFFRTHYAAAYHGVLGIVLASTLSLVPIHYTGMGEISLSALCCVAGFAVAFGMERIQKPEKLK